MRTLVKLVLTTVALGALVVLLAGPVGADQYPPSQGAPSAPAGGAPAAARPSGGIPFTGSSSTIPLVWIGVGAVALGGALVVGVRRRHQVRTRHLDA